jgi:hypothetical protein
MRRDKTAQSRLERPMDERNEYSGPFIGRVQTRIRMDRSLYDQLERSAQESGRSVNSEVVRRLEQSFEQSSKVELLQRALEKADERFDALMDLLAKNFTRHVEAASKNEGIRMGGGSGPGIPGWPPKDDDK